MGQQMSVWIYHKLQNKGWNISELSRQAGLSHGYVSEVLSGKKKPGIKFYKGVSSALGVTMDSLKLLDEAGVDPEAMDDEERLSLREIYDLVSELSPAQQFKVVRFVWQLKRNAGGDEPADAAATTGN